MFSFKHVCTGFVFLSTVCFSHILSPELGHMKLYTVLEVDSDAPFEKIKKQYRQLSLKYHPDKHSGDITYSTEHFTLINQAYEIIGDPKTRKIYDFYGEHYADLVKYFDSVAKSRVEELYSYRHNLLILSDFNFDKVMLRSPHTWIITFYHPDCGSCRRAVHTVTELAALSNKTSNSTRVAVVNCRMSYSVCQGVGISHMGQTFIFPPNQEANGYYEKTNYEGPFNPSAILKFAQTLPPSNVETITSMAQLLSIVESSPSEPSASNGELTGIWLVDFWRPTCPPCRTVKSALRSLSIDLKGVLKIVTLDCDLHPCPGVHSFPSFNLVVKRKNRKAQVVDLPYEQERHPGIGAIKTAGLILKEVVGISLKDERHKDEL